jgi:hypothetical protein
MNKNIQKLISDIMTQCVTNGINFRLEHTDQVDQENIPCSGYFDEQTLAVATKKEKMLDWLDILVHESCHLDQFIAGPKVWMPDEETLFIVEGWIHGKSIPKKKLEMGFKNTIALELDCEKRTIAKMQKYKIRFDKNQYIQKANSYLFSYTYAYINKAWYPKPYEKPKIYNNMPTKFLTVNEYFDINSKYFQYFL